MAKKIYRPQFVEPEQMLAIGYRLLSDSGAYLKYESIGGKALKREGRTHEQPLWDGQGIIYFNCEYCPQDKLVFCAIEQDAGTRKVYNGVIKSDYQLNLILKLVE